MKKTLRICATSVVAAALMLTASGCSVDGASAKYEAALEENTVDYNSVSSGELNVGGETLTVDISELTKSNIEGTLDATADSEGLTVYVTYEPSPDTMLTYLTPLAPDDREAIIHSVERFSAYEGSIESFTAIFAPTAVSDDEDAVAGEFDSASLRYVLANTTPASEAEMFVHGSVKQAVSYDVTTEWKNTSYVANGADLKVPVTEQEVACNVVAGLALQEKYGAQYTRGTVLAFGPENMLDSGYDTALNVESDSPKPESLDLPCDLDVTWG
jgi:hypothetical protein